MRKYILFTFVTLFCFTLIPFNVSANEKESDAVTLSKCVDGNSARFMLSVNEIKAKFIGIDSYLNVVSDESDEINGSLVSDYVCSILTNAKNIKIEYEPNSEKTDNYGRYLVWVFVDGELLQENLVKNGYSKVAYLYDDYKYNEKLKEAEKYAKENKNGIWKEEEQKPANTNTETTISNETESDGNIFTLILNFINEIFEKFLKFVDDLIENVL